MTAVILLFASAMAVAQEQDVGSRSQRPIPAPVEFRCAPKVLTATDTLTLTFSGPHGAELGVWAPDTRFLFIAFVQETPQSVPPIRGEEFAQMRSLKLSVKGATGLDYIGSSEPRVIFCLERIVLSSPTTSRQRLLSEDISRVRSGSRRKLMPAEGPRPRAY